MGEPATPPDRPAAARSGAPRGTLGETTAQLTAIMAALDQVQAEQRTQALQLAGLTAMVLLVAGMIWVASKQLDQGEGGQVVGPDAGQTAAMSAERRADGV